MPEIFNASQQGKSVQNSSATRLRGPDDYSQVLSQEEPTNNPFRSYAPKPLNVSFDSQGSHERILLLMRKHLLTQVPWILIAIFLAFLPFLLALLPPFDLLPGRFQFAALLGWYLLLIGYAFELFLSWFFNVFIITDERVIDVDFLSLIYKNISATKIDNIEDVTATTGGAFRSVFDFGTVKVQTSAEKREFEFEDVPHPSRVTSLLNELILEEEREKHEGRVS